MPIKSLSTIAWNVDEPTYRSGEGYSYSTLAKFQKEGFNGLPTLFDKVESPSLLFGSVVDCLITGTPEEFNERFVVAEFPELQDSRIKVIQEIFNTAGGVAWDKISDAVFNAAIEKQQFQMNWKPETRVKVIRECGKEYYDILCVSSGKSIVSNEMYNDAVACVEALKTSEATKVYFAADNPFDDRIQRLYQLKFTGEYEGIPLRCMADLLYVDNLNKFVCPIDLKTSSHKEWDFGRSFIEWRYMIQSQLYWYIIRQAMDKDEVFKDYKLLNTRFIVISNGSRVPLVWEFEDAQSEEDFKCGNYTIPNWRKIVKDLDYYLKNNPIVPIGIKANTTNSLRDWLKNTYGE